MFRSDAIEQPRMRLQINGVDACTFIKCAYGLGADLNGPGRYDITDPVQTNLQHIKGWIEMAEHDALEARHD